MATTEKKVFTIQNGSVWRFDRFVMEMNGSTTAVSAAQARNNFVIRAKKQLGLEPWTRVSVQGAIKEEKQ